MARRDSVLLPHCFVTLVIEHFRFASGLVKKASGLTYNEFLALEALRLSDGPLQIEPMADYLMLKKRSVVSMLLDMEDAGLVWKAAVSGDARKMAIAATPTGVQAASAVSRTLRDSVSQVFWGNLPRQEYYEIMCPYVVEATDLLRGHKAADVRLHDDADCLPIGLLIFWRAIIAEWSRLVHREGSISLGSYRVLAAVADNPMCTPSEVAEELCIQRSRVAIDKRPLLDQGLIVQRPAESDARKALFRPTSKGASLARRLTQAIASTANEAHENVPSEGMMAVNAWHARAYANIRAYRSK